MKTVPAALALWIALATMGCAHLRARTEPVSPPLEMPAPPPRVVTATLPATTTAAATTETIPADPQPPSPPEQPEVDARRPVRSPAAAPARQDKPDPAAAGETARPAAPSSVPSPTLQTTTNVGEAERRVRATIAQATRDLSRINARGLNAEAKAQYDIAKRFVEQAGDAVTAKNFVFAGQLADKAANLATLLLTQ